MLGCPSMSFVVNDLYGIGNTQLMYKLRLWYGRVPECPLQSPAVLPRPRRAFPKGVIHDSRHEETFW